MATQKEWMDHSYQEWLAKQGIATYTLVNHAALMRRAEHLASERERLDSLAVVPKPIEMPVVDLFPRSSSPVIDVTPVRQALPTTQFQASSTSALDDFGEQVVAFTTWIIGHVPPLRRLVDSAGRLASCGRAPRMWLAAAGAAMAVFVVMPSMASGDPRGLAIVAAVGGAVGFYSPFMLAPVLIAAAHMLALAMGATFSVMVLGLAVRLITLFA